QIDVDVVDANSGMAEAHLAGARRRRGQPLPFQDFSAAEAVEDDAAAIDRRRRRRRAGRHWAAPLARRRGLAAVRLHGVEAGLVDLLADEGGKRRLFARRRLEA